MLRVALLVWFCAVVIACQAGVLGAQTCSDAELLWDVRNCGTCGNDCTAGAVHSIWSCDAGTCRFEGCESGWYDIDGDRACEYACTFSSAEEACNGVDDDCDGTTDEDPVAPAPVEVCGVGPEAVRSECSTEVVLTCDAGAWTCTFPAGVCTGGCSADDEVCDELDNDCDGQLNENVAGFGESCASDDGLGSHGACRTVGTYVCQGPESVVCSATMADCSTLPGGCAELCDGIDNDCDGLVDESYLDKGSDADYFVQPAVIQIAASRWVFAYEASRPGATATSSGTGNGYHCLGLGCPPGVPPAPTGVPLDETLACSVPGRMPWFGVTPVEAEQTCAALGGFVCDMSDMISACQATVDCEWGYSPRGSACTTPFSDTKYCNLAVSYDVEPETAGIQDGILETASPELLDCAADWSGLLGNTLDGVFDVTGNLREITAIGSGLYPLMGGSFLSLADPGATCDFDFLVTDEGYSSRDTGFRCCFDSDPRR